MPGLEYGKASQTSLYNHVCIEGRYIQVRIWKGIHYKNSLYMNTRSLSPSKDMVGHVVRKISIHECRISKCKSK